MKLLAIILSVLPAILTGDFTPKTLSVAEQDSILNGLPEIRYRLEKENEQKIFRHSETAEYYILDTMRHTRKRLGEGMGFETVRDAQMSGLCEG